VPDVAVTCRHTIPRNAFLYSELGICVMQMMHRPTLNVCCVILMQVHLFAFCSNDVRKLFIWFCVVGCET